MPAPVPIRPYAAPAPARRRSGRQIAGRSMTSLWLSQAERELLERLAAEEQIPLGEVLRRGLSLYAGQVDRHS